MFSNVSFDWLIFAFGNRGPIIANSGCPYDSRYPSVETWCSVSSALKRYKLHHMYNLFRFLDINFLLPFTGHHAEQRTANIQSDKQKGEVEIF